MAGSPRSTKASDTELVLKRKEARKPQSSSIVSNNILLGSILKGSGTEQNICILTTVLIIAHVIKHQRTFETTHIKKS